MTTDRMVCLTIDDREITVPAGTTVYAAATQAGIHIPTFCHHEKLVPVGACRMCLVEIEGARGLQTACTTPAREGMVVRVHTSPAAVKARRANIEFLLTNHPLDCPVCDKGGECLLQDQALQDGPGQSRYIEEKRHKAKRKPLSDHIVLDQERCVLCRRCIRFLDEWADDHQLDLFGRGAETVVDTFPGQPLTSRWQGNVIDLCPVGALTSRDFRFQARVWELTETPGVCGLCAVGCNITLGVKNNVLRRITPRSNPAVNDVWLCDRGRFGHTFVSHPDRLRTPLVRRGDALQPATWEEALDLVARRLGEILAAQGPQAVGGLGSAQVSNEANYLLQRFLRTVVGTNNVDHLRRIPAEAAPLSALPTLEQGDVIVLLGFDPSSEAPLIELWIKKAVLRHGARVIVANPQRIELNRYGGPWLAYRPGGETALLRGLTRSLLEAGAGGEKGAARRLDLEGLRAALGEYTPPQVEKRTGAAAQALGEAAELLAQAAHPILLYGPGWGGEPGPLRDLALLLGDAEAAFIPAEANSRGALEMGVAPHLYPGGRPFDDLRARNRLAGVWSGRLSPVAGLDWAGMVAAAQEGDLRALWIVGADPAHGQPPTAEALERLSLLVVQDLFLTETARLADVVLPAASLAEVEGSLINLTGRWQALHPALRPPGQARPHWQIIAEAARRMAAAKGRRAWAFADAAAILREMARILPGCRSLDAERMGDTGWQPE